MIHAQGLARSERDDRRDMEFTRSSSRQPDGNPSETWLEVLDQAVRTGFRGEPLSHASFEVVSSRPSCGRGGFQSADELRRVRGLELDDQHILRDRSGFGPCRGALPCRCKTVQDSLYSLDVCTSAQVDDRQGRSSLEHDRVVVDLDVDTMRLKSLKDRLQLVGRDRNIGPRRPIGGYHERSVGEGRSHNSFPIRREPRAHAAQERVTNATTQGYSTRTPDSS